MGWSVIIQGKHLWNLKPQAFRLCCLKQAFLAAQYVFAPSGGRKQSLFIMINKIEKIGKQSHSSFLGLSAALEALCDFIIVISFAGDKTDNIRWHHRSVVSSRQWYWRHAARSLDDDPKSCPWEIQITRCFDIQSECCPGKRPFRPLHALCVCLCVCESWGGGGNGGKGNLLNFGHCGVRCWRSHLSWGPACVWRQRLSLFSPRSI